MTDWIALKENGIYCLPGEFFLDPHRAASKAIISHAHADHYPRYCGEIHATAATIAIGEHRYQNTAAKQAIVHGYGEWFQLGPVRAKLIPAGHILGSAQVLLEYNGETVLYSGDIDFDHNPTCESLQMPEEKVDWLICESTFGEKESHPSPEAALASCMEVAGKRNLMIGVYALGKAQRINHLLSKHFPDIKVFTDRTIGPLNSIYKQFGFDPGQYEVYRKQDAKRHHGQYAWLIPPMKMTGFKGDRIYYKVVASGWDKTNQAWVNGMLEISDHASQSELMNYIEAMQPKHVRFWHGYPSKMIAQCLEKGIDAGELGA